MPSLNEALKQVQAWIAAGNLDAASKRIAELRSAYPESADVIALSGFVAAKQGHLAQAVTDYQCAIAIRPEIADWHYHLARAYEMSNRHGEASAAYRRAMELAPQVAAYRNNYAQSLLQEWHQAVGLPTVGREAHKTYAEKLRSGFFQKYLAGAAVLDIGYRGDFAQAVPIMPQAVGIDRDTPGYDGLNLPYAEQTQDAVYSSHCLEHLPDPVAALREWHRVLKPGGYLVIAVPHQHLYERKAAPPSLWNPDHKHFFTPATLLAAVETALPPNTYRVRRLQDNDFLYDYTLAPTDAPAGCYEIELVLERIAVPAYRTIDSGGASSPPQNPTDEARQLDGQGVAAYQAGHHEEALGHFNKVCTLFPDWFVGHWHRGVCLHALRLYPAALSAYRRAIELNPEHPTLRYHAAKALKDSGDLAAAQESYARALQLDPDNPEILYSQGLLFLLMGDWLRGWPGYELRFAGSDRADIEHRPATALPNWGGKKVSPESGIVVYAEQGMGDTLMVWRYATVLRQYFRRVKFSVQWPLASLLQANLPDGVEVVPRIAEPIDETGFTHHLDALSLPARMGITPTTVPAAPYLAAPAQQIRRWHDYLASVTKRKVGLVWQGGKLTHAPARDMNFAYLKPLLCGKDITWISLQKEVVLPADAGVLDLGSQLDDFTDTAGLVANLDLVIAVDTAVAHLAGALGRPVWLLNRFESEWRWLRGQTDTPWYPSMRIFTQPAPGDWAAVIADVQAALAEGGQ